MTRRSGHRWLVQALLGGVFCASAAAASANADVAAPERPLWEREGRDWPNRNASEFVEAGGLRWHFQRMGQGPVLLLVHGTGAATHSWHELAPLLARDFTVIAPDLPGHGFTSAPPEERFSLPAMAGLMDQLLTAVDASPALAVGHSAGAAILARMALDGLIAPRGLVSLNGALLWRRGLAFQIFAPIVRAVVTTDLAAQAFAWRASNRKVVARTLASTGSTLDPDELDWYARLFRTPGHTGATLKMMAQWDLAALERDLPRLARPMVLITASEDGFIPPEEAHLAEPLIPQARVEVLPGLGHLAHEERPELVAALIRDAARSLGVIGTKAAAGPADRHGMPAKGLVETRNHRAVTSPN